MLKHVRLAIFPDFSLSLLCYQQMPSCCTRLERFGSLLVRRKCIEAKSHESKLRKCLSTWDLTLLGIGCTIGSGAYMVVGEVAALIAGPSILLCFIVAGIASVFAGLCYAEFGARVPLAGSAYVYSYVSVGEVWAFVIGWNVILEYVIGGAGVAKALSAYIDMLCNYAISAFMKEYLPMNVPTFATYTDLLAFGFIVLFTVILCLGVQESALLNSIFTILNLGVLTYAFICGMFWVDGSNWSIPSHLVPDPAVYGSGGFFPYGVQGTLAGAATCFYAYVGFDIITSAGEECINPAKSIPRAIICCLSITSVIYIVTAIVLTLMVPYFDLDPAAALAAAFSYVGWPVAAIYISVGAICALFSSLLVGTLSVPRIVYSMASDGLIFSCFAKVNDRFKTPIRATVFSGLLTGILAMLLDLKSLIEMMSIGTLLAYTLVAVCVILLRYEPDWKIIHSRKSNESEQSDSMSCMDHLISLWKPREAVSTPKTFRIVQICLGLIGVFCIWCVIVTLVLCNSLDTVEPWLFVFSALPLALIIVTTLILWRQPTNVELLNFKVPCVPFIPVSSMCLNICLMLNLSPITWLRFAIWMTTGFIIYFSYGIRHNALHIRSEEAYTEIPGDSGLTVQSNVSTTDVDHTTGGASVVTTEPVHVSDRTELINTEKY